MFKRILGALIVNLFEQRKLNFYFLINKKKKELSPFVMYTQNILPLEFNWRAYIFIYYIR